MLSTLPSRYSVSPSDSAYRAVPGAAITSSNPAGATACASCMASALVLANRILDGMAFSSRFANTLDLPLCLREGVGRKRGGTNGRTCNGRGSSADPAQADAAARQANVDGPVPRARTRDQPADGL